MAELKIESEEDFEKWLEGKPKEVSVVLASRIALRVFPLVGSASFVDSFGKTIVLPTLWASTLPWVGAKYTTHHRVLGFVAAAHAAHAANAAAAIAADDAFDAIIYAIYAANDAARTIAATASTATKHAVGAAFSAIAAITGDLTIMTGASTIWETLTEDCRWLESEGIDISIEQTAGLAGRPLWPDGVPKWMQGEWSDLGQILLDEDESWRVWINWYKVRLHGQSTIKAPADIVEKLDLDIALIDKALWEEGPLAVNAEVQRLIDEALEEAREREKNTPSVGLEGEVSKNDISQAINQNFSAIRIFAKGLAESVDEEIDRHQSKKPNQSDEDWDRYSAFLETMKGGFYELNEMTSTSDVNGNEISVADDVSDLFKKLRHNLEEFLEKNPGIKPASFITMFGGLMVLVGLTPWIATTAAVSLFGGPELIEQIGKMGKMGKKKDDDS